MKQTKPGEYRKIEIDNPFCKRRFHIAWEEGNSEKVAHTKIVCPNCGTSVLEKTDHPALVLLRVENLIKSPDGTNPLMQQCQLFTRDHESQ